MAGEERKLPVFDRAQLDRQALGDRQLADEVLRLFRDQLGPEGRSVVSAPPEMRGFIAHKLKGAAQNIGAGETAAAAAALEAAPGDETAAAALAASIETLLAAIETALADG